MKRLIFTLLTISVLLGGCASSRQPEQTQYTATFLNLFDTVTTVVGRDESKAAFQEKAEWVRSELEVYHRLFDIYNEYPDMNNLKTVNDQAGIAPVKVDEKIIALLQDCKRYETLTEGKVNTAMGGVLKLWHESRTAGIEDPLHARLPDMQMLQQAAKYKDISCVVIDEKACTVFITDSRVQLDVGAVAKGWATQRVAEIAPKGLLISVGGNVCATGPKTADGTPWVVGIQKPEGEGYLHTIRVAGGCVVTSGDYQRTYTVSGKSYHHIIDPETLMPANLWRSVSVVCEDSALADALSTALFLMPLEQGRRLAKKCGAEVMWLDLQGEKHYTPRFETLIRT